MNNNKFKIINFNKATPQPKNTMNGKRKIVEWGENNLYPDYLLDLYNFEGSTLHKAIINKKVKMLTGQGLEDITDLNVKKFADRNDLGNELNKIAYDYEIFNGFAFELVYDRLGENLNKLKHIPFNQIRIGIETEELSDEHFWVSTSWKEYRKDMHKPQFIKKYNGDKSGRQLYYYTEYNPSPYNLYPIAGYSNSTTLNYIELDFQISQFHLNQAKQGYAPSFILNMSNGLPSEEEMEEFYREFKRNFAGTENAGKAFITYSEGQDKSPVITPFALNDSDERFLQLKESIQENIVMGTEIPPQLVILQPGKLGSTEERNELLQEFQKTYISPRQKTIENCLKRVTGFDFKLKKYQE